MVLRRALQRHASESGLAAQSASVKVLGRHEFLAQVTAQLAEKTHL